MIEGEYRKCPTCGRLVWITFHGTYWDDCLWVKHRAECRGSYIGGPREEIYCTGTLGGVFDS